jgi:hypothetical protein
MVYLFHCTLNMHVHATYYQLRSGRLQYSLIHSPTPNPHGPFPADISAHQLR